MNREISAWQKELRRNPGSAAFARLAESLRAEGRLDEATWVCARGLSACPRYATGHAILGEILAAANLNSRARQAFLHSIHLDPHNARARVGVAKIYFTEGKYQQTIDHLDLLLFWQPSHEEARQLTAQAQATLNSQQVDALLSITAGPEPTEPAVENAAAAPQGLVQGREGDLVQLLFECDSVSEVMVISSEGLLVAAADPMRRFHENDAATLASICEASNRYLMKLGLGYLEGCLIEEESRSVQVLRFDGYTVAVGLKSDARLGTAEVEIAGALNKMDRRRKFRATDDMSEFLPEGRDA